MAKIPKAVFRFIEHELFNYDRTRKRIEELNESLVSGSAPVLRELGKGSGQVSDPTPREVIRKLTTTTAIDHLTHTFRSINLALNRLSPAHQDLFHWRYQRALPREAVCQHMPCSERQFYKLREELVGMVGLQMGVIVEL